MAITISKAIVHEVPKGAHSTKSDTDVTLSTELTPLEVETRRFIIDNMVKFALKHPRDIKWDQEALSTTPAMITKIIEDDNDSNFVEASQHIAKTLYRSQTANSPSGILVVAMVRKDGRDAVLLMKAEHQEGMRLRRDEGSGRLDLEHLNELIVGQNSKIYKVAIMELADDGSVVGQMVDQQNGVQYADFFLAGFLGCQLADKAELQTKVFMESAIAHFNGQLNNPVKASRYAGALSAYMHAPAEEFQPSEFADEFLEPEDRDDFLAAIPDSVGDAVIRKEFKLLAGGGSGVRIIGHGFTVVASSEAFSSGSISVTQSEDGATVIKLSGDVTKMTFGAVPKGGQ